jgi:hypothetical protein
MATSKTGTTAKGSIHVWRVNDDKIKIVIHTGLAPSQIGSPAMVSRSKHGTIFEKLNALLEREAARSRKGRALPRSKTSIARRRREENST